MKVLVCGDRNWSDRLKIWTWLDCLPDDAVVVEGGCRGADRMAREYASERGLRYIEMPADWLKYGRSGGPLRNREMLDMLDPDSGDLVLAFHPDLSRSKGTKDTVTEALKRQIRTVVVK